MITLQDADLSSQVCPDEWLMKNYRDVKKF